jgi:hypothetical protein
MSDPFASARSKFDRAKKHIAEVENIISALPNNSIATIEINPDGGNEVLKHDLLDRDKIINDIALMLGDAVHNLHCALDHAWMSVLSQLCPTSINNQTKFPIFPVRDKVEAALRGVKIDSTAPALFDLVLGQIKPYDGGNESIWPIHSLDIDDKHRLLLPIIEYASINGIEVENERGEVQKEPHGEPLKSLPTTSLFLSVGTSSRREQLPLRYCSMKGQCSSSRIYATCSGFLQCRF